MAETGDSDARTLAALRARIDGIDEAMHRLLMERGSVIDALIAAKGTAKSGAAFRPQREAEMMRRLAARHSGHLPLTAMEHLWRGIITTFTYLQAPFRVVVDLSGNRDAARDLARFSFGFTVELIEASGPDDVVRRIAASRGDLGLVPLARQSGTAWWRGLSMERGPRVMALLPFIGVDGRPAGTPAVVISPALDEPAPPDIAIYAAVRPADGALPPGTSVLAEAPGGEILVAAPAGPMALRGAGFTNITAAGGIARGIAVGSAGDLLRAPIREGQPA